MKRTKFFYLCLATVVAGTIGLFSFGFLGTSITGYFASTSISPIYQGKVDTGVTTGTDTLKSACGIKPTSITFSTNIWKVAGSPTVNVALYGSADGGVTYGTTAITTFTMVPTSLYSATTFNTNALTNTYTVNNTTGGNPYTNYMWVAAGTASSTWSWQQSALVR